jgi:drug/metabolite transporter (DMT)-like permease
MASEKQIKPGYKSTEFWLATVAALCGILFASGTIAPESGGDKVLGIVAGVLASLGYSVSRGLAKKE